LFRHARLADPECSVGKLSVKLFPIPAEG